MKPNKRRFAGGFTLLEVLCAVVLIGTAIVSLVAASGAFTMINGAGLDLSTAEFLIEEIREMTAPMTFDEVAALNWQNYSPPVDLTGAAMAEFGAYTQRIRVQTVSPTLSAAQAGSDFARVEVTILKNGKTISSARWIRTNLD